MSTPLLDLRAVTTELEMDGQWWPVVDEVSFDVRPGEIVGLVGESGSGKSMTARTILRVLPATARYSGEVLFDGTNVLAADRRTLREIRARRIGMIFQDPRAHIDPLWRNEDYLTAGLRTHFGQSRATARRRAMELLADVGIRDRERVLRAYPGELSGGMLQRVMIAGTLSTDPDLIIADEPTTALDVTIQAEIVAIFHSLRQDRDLAMLFITHDLELASALCDRVLVLYAGRVVEEQPTRLLFSAPLHPYTAGLLAARPRLDSRPDRLDVIPGRPPVPFETPTGCPFHPRCPFVEEACITARPPLRRFSADARSACRRTDEIHEQLKPIDIIGRAQDLPACFSKPIT